jgi:hypothetical protein
MTADYVWPSSRPTDRLIPLCLRNAAGVWTMTAIVQIRFQLTKTYCDLDEPALLTLRAYFPMTPQLAACSLV